MNIESFEFISSVYKVEQVPKPFLPEIAFFGRSNVGKSTLINGLLGKKTARVSSTPGKTQCLNYYRVNGRFHLVDAPGYGYAKVEKRLRDAWQKNLEAWLSVNDRLKLAVVIVDARIPPQASDRQMADFLFHFRIPVVIVANKIDKLKSRELRPNLKAFSEIYGSFGFAILPASGLTGEGIPDILAACGNALA